ncbi:serine hydrolase [Enterococcus sp. DIV0187]|uniref:serine hydrolase n=1 Tax=Enterococcus sp. DIV0187 TaxID=2774644 RepID=UPI003F687B3B
MKDLGRHTDPNEKSKGKYVVVGLAALLLAGGVYFGVTRILNNTAEKPKETVTAKESQSSSKEQPAASSTKKTTKKSSEKKAKKKKTTETSKKKTKTSSSSKKQASAEKKSASKAKKKTTAKLDASELTKSAGKVYYGVQYLKTKQEFSSKNSERTIAANIIELFIMDYALAQKDGNNQVIEDKPLNEWLTPMIQQNDINATNVLIDHYGMGNMNSYFKDQGYADTYIERRMVDINVRSTDKDNYTSLNDCMKLLKKIYDSRDKEPQKTMLDILKGQVIRTKIPAKLPDNIPVANITGEQQNVENDIGLVLTEDNPFAIVVLTNETSDIVKTRTAIADFSLAATKIKE